jgi:outer membrane lipoprotein-sorting protein
MRSPDNVAKFFKNAAIDTNPQMDEVVLDRVLTAQKKTINIRSAEFEPKIRRMIMKSKITRIAALVAIIISILAVVNYLGLQVKMTAPVFADMIEEISKARSVTYTWTIYREEELLSTTEHMVNASGVQRMEFPHGCVAIYDRRSGKQLQITPESEKALLIYKVGRDKGKGLNNYLDWLSNLHGESGRFRGHEEIDGRTAGVFVVQRDFRRTTVWVDPETDLPVRVEQVWLPPAGEKIVPPNVSLHERDFGGEENNIRSITISGDGVQESRRIIWSDFTWNPSLKESLFSLEPPEGYAVEEMTHDVSDRGENGLIDALTFWTEMSAGLFPSNIEDLGDPNKLRPVLIEKFDRDGDPKEELDQAMKQMNIVLKGLWFAQKCKVQSSWHYDGANVRLGDADKPICWWKPEDSDVYRVIYGDLSIGDSSEAPQPAEEK